MADQEGKPEGAENETSKIDLTDDNSTTVHLDPDESKAHLINANGGAGRGEHADEYKTAIVDPTPASSDGEVSFNGLGKEEVMRYANDPFWVRLRWILFILFWVGWLAMLVTAIAIIVLAPRCPPRPDLKWYQTETVYQVFPQSFKDSNGDGIGDFKGLKDKMDYLTDDLKINAIWINSMFMAEKNAPTVGIIDHKAIDSSFGATMDEFKAWLKKLRKEGKKVILDLIPNQTSKNHTWFQSSQAEEDPYKDYYIWHEGPSPPNNWKSMDGSLGWSRDPVRGAWYYHQFSADYPDLNLTNENVRNEIKDIMKFWFDAGVSGFHIQGLEYLVENPDVSQDDDASKSQTKNFPGTLDFLEELRTIANQFSDKPGREKLVFGTLNDVDDPNGRNLTHEYWGTKENKRLHIVSPLLTKLDASCDAKCVADMIEDLLTDDNRQWLGFQLGNENVPRIASRLTDSTNMYQKRLMAAHTLQLLLPGTPFNYYGDEFGQRDGNASPYPNGNYRTPMQWNKEDNAGFADKGVTPWNPVGPNYETENLGAMRAHFSDLTPLKAFVDMVELRTSESFQWGKTKICAMDSDVLMFTRKATRFPYFLTIINMSENKKHVAPRDLECVPSNDEGTVKFHSREESLEETLNFKDFGISLEPYDIIVVKFESDE